MKRVTGFIFVLALLFAACAPEIPEAPGVTARRGVVVNVLQPEPFAISVRMPVVVHPFREIELRAATAGRIVSLPYEEGDLVEAASLPTADWTEQSEYIAANGGNPDNDVLELRNLRHLDDVAAFARIDTAQLVQSLREAQASYDQAVRDLRRLQNYPQTTGAELDQARTRRNVARATAERTLAAINESYIFTPMTGILIERPRQQGEFVAPGELIGRVAVMDPLLAELQLPEAHFHALKAGDAIDITLEGLNDPETDRPVKVQGVVHRIDRVAHARTHTFKVEIRVDNEDLALPAGVFGAVNLTIYRREQAMTVPFSAIKLDGEQRSLFVVDDKNVVHEVKDLKIGRFSANRVELRDERVKAGMKVVTLGAQWLSHGDTVNWTEQDPFTGGKAE